MPPKPQGPTTKTCDECGREYHRRRPNGKLIHSTIWANQRYCGVTCARKASGRTRAKHEIGNETRQCVICGKTYHRPRFANGKLQDARRWNARRVCGLECKAIDYRRRIGGHPDTKTCKNCGTTMRRRREPSGRLETSSAWARRTACSDACARQLRRKPPKPKPVKAPKAAAPEYDHPPCPTCGKPVDRRAGESRKNYRRRIYCSLECGHKAMVQERFAKALKPRRLAPEGYVFNGRFPTPKAAKAWVPVTGPDATENVAMPARSKPDAGTRTALRAAIARHPELALALAEAIR